MYKQQNPNLDILEMTVARLQELADEMVFLGGCATGLLISDPAAPPIRATQDVDTIVHVISRAEYYRLCDRLREKQFKEDTRDGAPMCRWIMENLVLDVMPTDPNILGFSNCWYPHAMQHALPVNLPSGKIIRMVSAPYFLMTKLEAFDGRGKGDYMMSHDMEDFVAVLDGRKEIVDEIIHAAPDLRSAIVDRFKQLLSDKRFTDAALGYMPTDAASQARVEIVLKTMRIIAEQ